MPIIPIFIVFSYMLALIGIGLTFNKELIYYRTSLAGNLVTKLDSELLVLALERYDLSILKFTSGMHFHASLVCSLFDTLLAGKCSNKVFILFSAFTNSLHVFFNLCMLAGLHARMRPGSTGRFFISAVLVGSAAFNLLSIGSLFFSTPCRAAVSLYNDINLVKGSDGFYSAVDVKESSALSASINDLVNPPTKGRLFSGKTVLYTIGLVTAVGLLWGVKCYFFPGDNYALINGVSVKYPRDPSARPLWDHENFLSQMERERFEKVGVSRYSVTVDSVTGRFPECFYYRQSFMSDFKDRYLAFHDLAPDTPVNWVAVLVPKVPGSAESFAYAHRIKPMMSFKDPTTLIVNLLQGRIYFGIGVEKGF